MVDIVLSGGLNPAVSAKLPKKITVVGSAEVKP
jgi:hypothetical protein